MDVVELLLHDAATVAEFGERFRQRTAEPATHAGGQYYDLRAHDLSPQLPVVSTGAGAKISSVFDRRQVAIAKRFTFCSSPDSCPDTSLYIFTLPFCINLAQGWSDQAPNL